MRLSALICVTAVPASSTCHQYLIGLRSGHAGVAYERVNAGKRLVVQRDLLKRDQQPYTHRPPPRFRGSIRSRKTCRLPAKSLLSSSAAR